MAHPSHHDFDPYNETSFDAVEMIEFLPDSIAFEHVMYNNRLDRTTKYEYAHSEDTDNPEDVDPLIIDHKLMLGQFPEELRGAFPEIEYTIERLEITQAATQEDAMTSLSFFANGRPHAATVTNTTASYETINEYMEPVRYEVSPEAITGLLATFLYAKQYDPDLTSQNPMELVESSILTERDPLVDLNERIIMSLGNHSGHSSTETRAMFDSPTHIPIVATLMTIEFPDRSASTNTLALNEIDEIQDMPTSVETTLYQSIVNIEQESPILGSGKITNRYAEQRSMVLSSLPVTSSEYITPKDNYERWVRTCTTFKNLIAAQMSQYAELDN